MEYLQQYSRIYVVDFRMDQFEHLQYPQSNFFPLHTLHLPSNFLQLRSNLLFLLLAFLKQLLQLTGKIRHFLLERHSVAFVFGDSYVSARSQDEVLSNYLLSGAYGTEALFIPRVPCWNAWKVSEIF